MWSTMSLEVLMWVVAAFNWFVGITHFYENILVGVVNFYQYTFCRRPYDINIV
jgi:hypothetical protein